MLLGVWYALADRSTDLVEGRRRLRVWYAIVTALYAAMTIAADWLWPGGLSSAPFSLANAAGLMGLIFLFAVLGSLTFSSPQVPAPALAGQRDRFRTTFQQRRPWRPTWRSSQRSAS